jgi:hypothetical protein
MFIVVFEFHNHICKGEKDEKHNQYVDNDIKTFANQGKKAQHHGTERQSEVLFEKVRISNCVIN